MSSEKLHRNPPFRAEHLGSLLRPEQLLSIKHALDNGKSNVAKEDLTKVEDVSINEIVQAQLDLGFHAVTDGEYRRHMFWYVTTYHSFPPSLLPFLSPHLLTQYSISKPHTNLQHKGYFLPRPPRLRRNPKSPSRIIPPLRPRH